MNIYYYTRKLRVCMHRWRPVFNSSVRYWFILNVVFSFLIGFRPLLSNSTSLSLLSNAFTKVCHMFQNYLHICFRYSYSVFTKYYFKSVQIVFHIRYCRAKIKFTTTVILAKKTFKPVTTFCLKENSKQRVKPRPSKQVIPFGRRKASPWCISSALSKCVILNAAASLIDKKLLHVLKGSDL